MKKNNENNTRRDWPKGTTHYKHTTRQPYRATSRGVFRHSTINGWLKSTQPATYLEPLSA